MARFLVATTTVAARSGRAGAGSCVASLATRRGRYGPVGWPVAVDRHPPRSPERPSARLDVPVDDPRGDLFVAGEMARDPVGDDDRAVAAPRAADGEGQVRLALGDV